MIQNSSVRLRLADWRESPHFVPLLIVSSLTAGFIAIFFINEPFPPISPDTASYLNVAEKIKNHLTFTDVYRTPGYPLFVAIVFLVFGDGDLRFVSVAQAALYLIATLELYAITYLIFRRAWIAAAVAIVAAVNAYQFSYAKAILVEGFAMWTVITLALTIALFFRKPSARSLWLVAAALILAVMTRTEWLYVAVPLFALLVLSLRGVEGRGRLGLHAAAAVLLFYGVVGLYSYANGPAKSYGPLVVIPRINGFGKVLQYRMQDDAPAKYSTWTRRIDRYVAGQHVSSIGLADRGPYVFGQIYPKFAANHFELAGRYTFAAILNAPGEYVWKTIKFTNTANKYHWIFGAIHDGRIFAGTLHDLEASSRQTFKTYRFFPLFAAGCLAVWLAGLLKRREYQPRLSMLACLSFLGLYQLFVVTAGSYADWPRLYMTLNPTRILVVFGPTLLGFGLLVGRIAQRFRWYELHRTSSQ